ncbi:MAG: HAD family hydrolase [Armatimonadota bacterium]
MMRQPERSPPFRLLLLDVDGTLIGESEIITSRDLVALRAAQNLGCTIALCTGRSRYAAQALALKLDGQGYGILFNGAVLVDWASGRLLRKRVLTNALVREAVHLIEQRGLAPICEGTEEDDRWLRTNRRLRLPERYAALNVERLLYCDDLDAPHLGPPITIGAYGPADAIQPLAQECQVALGPAANVLVSRSHRYGCWCVEVYPPGVSKAGAAQSLTEMLRIPRESTLAIGDHLNDVELLRWAGLGVCMGDGHPEAQAGADYITASLADNGVAQALERFVLNRDAALSDSTPPASGRPSHRSVGRCAHREP